MANLLPKKCVAIGSDRTVMISSAMSAQVRIVLAGQTDRRNCRNNIALYIVVRADVQ